MSAPTAAERAQVIAGLRELADLLEAHPELPVTKYPKFIVHAGPVDTGTDDADEDTNRAIVDQAATILGTPVTDQHGHYETSWQSRGAEPYDSNRVKYTVVRISRARMAQHDAEQSYEGNIRAGGAR